MLHKGEHSGKGPLKSMVIDWIFKPYQRGFLCATEQEKEVTTKICQIELLHKKFKEALNVVIIYKENKKTGKKGQVILFSTDLTFHWNARK
jgi:putative transposase